MKARNSFVHDGIATIGDDVVTEEKARFFIIKAMVYISYIRFRARFAVGRRIFI